MAVDTKVVGVVSFYMVAALIMVFVNKIVLNSTPNLTILFMFFQSVMTVLLLNFTAFFSSSVDIPTLNLRTAKNLTPLILVDAAGFAFNAFCLRSVEAAFYQVARGLVLPLTITVVAVSSRQRPKIQVVGCAMVVTAGFFMGVSRSPNLPERSVTTSVGLIYGFLSSLAIAVHAVLVKNSLQYVDGSTTALSYWSNLGAAIILGMLALGKGEVSEFWTMAHSGEWNWTTFAWGNLVTGVFGFLISVAGILSVKVTSPVTHMFSSAARSVLQVALGVKIFGDVLTAPRAASVLTILTGTLLYSYVKSHEQHQQQLQQSEKRSGDEDRQLLPMRDLESQSTLFDASLDEEDDLDDGSTQVDFNSDSSEAGGKGFGRLDAEKATTNLDSFKFATSASEEDDIALPR